MKDVITSVIIPHWTGGRRLNTLRSVLDSLLSQTAFPQSEVLVVCNPPNQEVTELIALYGDQVKVFGSMQANVNVARNIGLKNALGRNLVFLDDDCVLQDKETLGKLSERLDGDETLAACGGDVDIQPNAGFWGKAYFSIQRIWIHNSQRPDDLSDHLFGGFLAAKAKSLNGIQFDESIRFGGSELSFVEDLRTRGRRVRWFPEFRVTHFYQITFRQFVYRAFKQGVTNGRKPSAGKDFLPRQVLQRKSRAQIVYGFFFDLGTNWGSSNRWRPGAYLKFLCESLRSWGKTSRTFRYFSELRRLYRIHLQRDQLFSGPEIRGNNLT